MITLGPKSPFLERAVDLSNRLIDFAQAEGYSPGEMAMAGNLIVMRLIEANEASKASVFFEPRTVGEGEAEPPGNPGSAFANPHVGKLDIYNLSAAGQLASDECYEAVDGATLGPEIIWQHLWDRLHPGEAPLDGRESVDAPSYLIGCEHGHRDALKKVVDWMRFQGQEIDYSQFDHVVCAGIAQAIEEGELDRCWKCRADSPTNALCQNCWSAT